VIAFWLTRAKKFKGNWTLYTTAIVLFSVGLLVQYRLYSDPEYNARNKAAARQEKTDNLAHALYQSDLRREQTADDGLVAHPAPVDAESTAERSQLHCRERDSRRAIPGFQSSRYCHLRWPFLSAPTIAFWSGSSEIVS